MEYKKDVRTENLTLRDIHVGDWVQVWSEITERYSPPLKIIQICDDGTIYLVISDEERPDPWEEDIKNVDALPITPELLRGFGFELREKRNITYGFVEYIFYGNFHIGHLYSYDNGKIECSLSCGNRAYFSYMHEMCDVIWRKFPDIKLEWKGIEK